MTNDKDAFDWSDLTRKTPGGWGVEVFKNEKHVLTIAFLPTITYIGRMPENNIVLEDPKISRSHAKISFHEGTYTIEDQQSENGVIVNGRKVDISPLRVGDTIHIGDFELKVTDRIELAFGRTKIEAESTELNERTISIQEALQPCEATVTVNIGDQVHSQRFQFSEVESTRVFLDEHLTVSLVIESEGAVIRKNFKITNT